MSPTSVPSFFFSFPVFFALVAALATAILVWIRFREDRQYQKTWFMGLFGLVGAWALLTQWCYVDGPQRYFTNADHHLIEHLGFAFGDQLTLADEQQPQTALWDDRMGSLRVSYRPNRSKFVLVGRNFVEPVYVQSAPEQYALQNALLKQPVRQEFTLRFDTLVVSFHLRFHPDSSSSFTVLHPTGTYGPFAIKLKMPLQKGYSLGGMLDKAPEADAPDLGGLITALDSTLLLRTTIGKNVPETEDQSVLLFPSKRLLETATELTIDGQPVVLPTKMDFDIAVGPEQVFFFGLWSDMGKRYQLRRNGAGGSEWLAMFPQKEYLKRAEGDDGNTSLFLTTSAAEVSNSEQGAGFYFPLFAQADNLNHLSANLAYHTGSTREPMRFRVINYDQNDLPADAIQTVGTGDTLRLQTRGMTAGQTDTQWLLRFANLKAENPLQLWKMLVLTLLLMAGIYGCIYFSPPERQTKAEYLAYLLLLALMTLRSVLLWRVSTFLPVEDITPKVYRSLADLGWDYFWLGGLFCMGFFAVVMAWKVWGHKLLARFVNATSTGIFELKILRWFGLYGVALLVKFGGAISTKLERVGSVFMPLVAYFVISFLLLRVLARSGRTVKDPTYIWLNRLNWFCCLAYLAWADAGFSIIFLVSTLLYAMVDQLTFPRAGQGNKLVYRLVFAGAVALGLLLFIVLAPWGLSLVFRHFQGVLYGLAGLSVLMAGRAFWRNQPLMLFDRLVPKWVVPGICLAVAVGLVGFQGTILKKVADKSYTRYRSEVLFRTPDQIIQEGEFKFNLGADSKLLRAAQNQWFIDYFYDKGSPNPLKPFRVLPSFQKGSPYMTQICDLVTVRYVIGEHSQYLITLLLGLMALLLLSATDADTRYNFFSMVRVRLLCLLFAIAFFVWMAATNRIVFLGQDFPILSLNSILTFLVTLSILLAVIVLGDYANVSPQSLRFFAGGQQQGRRYFQVLVAVALVGLLYVRQHDFKHDRFNLAQTIDSLKTAFNDLNPAFRQFQLNLDSTGRNRSPKELIEQFNHSAYAPQTKADGLQKYPFALSAYNAYGKRLDERNSPENLVHLRRRNDDTYEFVVNNHYYSVSSPDLMLNTWRGHLLAEPKNETVAFVDRHTNRNLKINPHRANANLFDTLRRLVGREAGNNLRLTCLPAGWTLDSLPLMLISRISGNQRVNKSAFVVKSGPDVFRSEQSRFAVVMRPNDVLQFEPYRTERPITVQYQHRTRQYFAKNVWLNGHYQFFYPLGDKFLWPYHFASLVRTKFDKEKDDNPEGLNRHISLSLDPQLIEKIHDLAARYFGVTKWKTAPQYERARAFNLVVLGSDGKLRALCDYQKGATTRIDPNRIDTYRDLFTRLSLETQIDQERMIFGNRCLLRMDNGPASTFKPILYSAVTSQYHFPWETLEFDGIKDGYRNELVRKNPGKDNYTVRRFGNGTIRLAASEANLRPHGVDEYISLSTNTYNSMMVYLGSLNRAQLIREHNYVRGLLSEGSFLARGYAEQPRNNFPILNIAGTPYHLRSLRVDWENSESLMGRGLWGNYNLPVTDNQLNGQARRWQNPALALDSTLFNTSDSPGQIWSFPEASHFYMSDRVDLATAIVQCATGSDPITTTPYKMAEMAASLFSFNKAFQSSVLAGVPQRYVSFESDPSWGNTRQLTRFYRQYLFRGMHESTLTGTAKNALGLPQNYPAEYRPYYFYAKTGTNSGKSDGGKRDKHLMLIISRDKLDGRDLTPDDLRNNHFMVLYFSFYKQSSGAEWSSGEDDDLIPTLREMIKTVIKSESFTTLMRDETNR